MAAYIAEQATTLKVSTLTRCLAAISIAHGERPRSWDRRADGGFPDAKTLKRGRPNHPGRDVGPLDRAAAGKDAGARS